MPTITIKDGKLVAEELVAVKAKFTCSKGTVCDVTLNMPAGVTFRSKISVDKNCPCCGEPVVFPLGEHRIGENGELVSEYITIQ